MEENFNNFGTDLMSDWNFTDGDLNLINGVENLSQSIVNRLNTGTDVLDYFYTDYGSVILQFLGWRKNSVTLNFIRLEIIKAISKDPRIDDVDCSVDFDDKGMVRINLKILSYNSDDFEINLLMSDEEGIKAVEV